MAIEVDARIESRQIFHDRAHDFSGKIQFNFSLPHPPRNISIITMSFLGASRSGPSGGINVDKIEMASTEYLSIDSLYAAR